MISKYVICECDLINRFLSPYFDYCLIISVIGWQNDHWDEKMAINVF